MKKIKILSISIIILLFLTGCDATYELVISNNRVEEKLLLAENQELIESFTTSQKYIQENLEKFKNEKKYEKYKVETYIDNNINAVAMKEYSSFDLFDKKSEFIHQLFESIEYKKDLKTTTIVMTPVDNFNYLDDNSLYMPFLNSIKLKIKLDKELVSGNYDEIAGEYYVWNINKMPLKKVEIVYKNDDMFFGKITKLEKISIILIALVMLFILETYLKFKIKGKF